MDRVKQLVKQRLAGLPSDPHPPADALSAFAENALPRSERQHVLAHLASCSDCREIVYLAQPQETRTQPVAVYRPRLMTHLAVRWAAVLAPVVIVAGGLFLVREEFSKTAHPAAVSEPDVLNKFVARQAPAELEARKNEQPVAPPASVVSKDRRSGDLPALAVDKVRPEEKHMTAKLKAPLKFDSSDQVQTPSSLADENRDMPVSSETGAGVAGGILGANAAAPSAAPQALARDDKDTGNYNYAAGKTAAAKNGSGSLDGTVLDQTGVAVPHARITVSNSTGSTTATTGQDGKFSFDHLGSGSYSLRAQASGFKVAEQAQVAVAANQTINLPVILQIAPNSGPVLVTGSAPEIEPSQQANLSAANLSAALLQTETFPVSNSKQQTTTEARSKEKKASVAQVESGLAGKPESSPTQWTLSANGLVQRSNDAGRTWQIVSLPDKAIFRAIFAAGPEVWVGGTAGALYHSRNSGQSWEKVTPAAHGKTLQSDVKRIEFSDPRHGSVSVANGETWFTNDVGKTWQKK
jgi:Carboxypeptidase regulatory-like domain/Photosynthesis system II assembly factor YCF48/Putative zinc-finger